MYFRIFTVRDIAMVALAKISGERKALFLWFSVETFQAVKNVFMSAYNKSQDKQQESILSRNWNSDVFVDLRSSYQSPVSMETPWKRGLRIFPFIPLPHLFTIAVYYSYWGATNSVNSASVIEDYPTSGVPQNVDVVPEGSIPSLQRPKSVKTTWPCKKFDTCIKRVMLSSTKL